MANYNELKSAIQQVIRTNGNNEITGALLQQTLISMIDSLGIGYTYKGVARPNTTPPVTDSKILYLAFTPGTYTAFGSLVLNEGEIGILKFDSAWSLDAMTVGAGITILDVKINEENTIVEVSNQSVFEKWALESPLKLVHIYDEVSDSGYYVLPDIFIIDIDSWQGEPDVSSVVKAFVFIPDRKLYLKIWSATEDWGEEGCEVVNTASGYFIDAPRDNISYARKNGNWDVAPFEREGNYKNAVLVGGANQANADYTVAEGKNTRANGDSSHAEGINSVAGGAASHAEGYYTKSSMAYSHAEGYYAEANGTFSHAEGNYTKTLGAASHAEGIETEANGGSSHAEGSGCIAGGDNAHAEGKNTKASGGSSHAEGTNCVADGVNSHAEGSTTNAKNNAEHAEGRYNYSNKNSNTFGDKGNTMSSVGIGTSASNRLNALEIRQNGEIYILGVKGFNGTNAQTKVNSLQKALEDIGVTIDWTKLGY